jgi:hypothetical protein
MKLYPRKTSLEKSLRRRQNNALYHQRSALKNPARKRAREKAWRDSNRAQVNSSARDYYDRNAARISAQNSFVGRLKRMLEKIVAAHEARGLRE